MSKKGLREFSTARNARSSVASTCANDAAFARVAPGTFALRAVPGVVEVSLLSNMLAYMCMLALPPAAGVVGAPLLCESVCCSAHQDKMPVQDIVPDIVMMQTPLLWLSCSLCSVTMHYSCPGTACNSPCTTWPCPAPLCPTTLPLHPSPVASNSRHACCTALNTLLASQ